MVPTFYLNVQQMVLSAGRRRDEHSVRETVGRCWNWFGRLRCGRPPKIDRTSVKYNEEDEIIEVGRVEVQMTSIFVTIPENHTVITYNNVSRKFRDLDFGDCDVPFDGAKLRPSETQQDKPRRMWGRVKDELKKGYSKLRQYNAQYLTYSILDEAVDSIGPVLHELAKEVEREKEFVKKDRYRNFDGIHVLLAELQRMHRKIKPLVRLLWHVIEDERISPGPTVYLRDVHDNLEAYEDEVRNLMVECEAVDEEADKHHQRAMDSTLYTLTVISAVFLPAQFLTGVWGMNFEQMRELDVSY